MTSHQGLDCSKLYMIVNYTKARTKSTRNIQLKQLYRYLYEMQQKQVKSLNSSIRFICNTYRCFVSIFCILLEPLKRYHAMKKALTRYSLTGHYFYGYDDGYTQPPQNAFTIHFYNVTSFGLVLIFEILDQTRTLSTIQF